MSEENIYVPNIGPSNAAIMVVGEAPGENEEKDRIPFHPEAQAGGLLMEVMQRHGVFRDEVKLANLHHYRPVGNRFVSILGSDSLKNGIEELRKEIIENKPTVIVAAGAWPLWFLTGKCGRERGKPKPGSGIENYRGSILSCTLEGCESVKVIPTYHPSFVARTRTKYPIFDADWARIVSDSKFRDLRLPEREFIIDPKGSELDDWVERIIASGTVSADIESIKYTNHILCYGFATDPSTCICIVNHGPHDFGFKQAVGRILSSGVKLIFHNGTFDQIVSENNGFQVKNYFWDTMVAQHSMWPELPRSLAYLTSVETREPYYKDEGKAEEDQKGWADKMNREKLYRYNCKDVGCTFEAYLAQQRDIADGPAGWRSTFEFEMSEIPVAVSISQTGMNRDQERAKELKAILLYQWLNTNSNKQMTNTLFDELGLPEKRKRDKYGKWVRTCDEDALVSLIGHCKDTYEKRKRADVRERWLKNLFICKTVLKIRGIRKVLSSYISVPISGDGRCRGFVKITGAETTRWSMSKYTDNTGMPMQTIPRDPVEVEADFFLDDPEKLDLVLQLEGALK
jgi:uracil-DNA glycosylase family 4